MGIFDADQGLGSGPFFQYFRSRSSPFCHYCSVFHFSLFFVLMVPNQSHFGMNLKLVQKTIYRKYSTQNGPRSTIMLVALSGHSPDHARWLVHSQKSKPIQHVFCRANEILVSKRPHTAVNAGFFHSVIVRLITLLHCIGIPSISIY